MVVTDSDNNPRSATKNFTIIIYPEDEVSITTAALAPGYVSEAYEGQMQAVGGVEPYTWSIVGPATELAPGLYLSESGLITGTPTAPGITVVEVRVDDNVGDFDTRNVTVTIYEPQEDLAILTGTYLPDRTLVVSEPYLSGYSLTAIGGVVPYTWEVEVGSAPIIDAGLALSSNGVLTSAGSPSAGEHSFSVKVTDGVGTVVYKIFIVKVY